MPRRYSGYSPGFSPRYYVAPNAGLTLGAGITQGILQGYQNAQNFKLRKMQMEALQMQRQAMATNAQANMQYRQAMAQRYAPADPHKVQLAYEAYMNPSVPKDISGPLLKQQVKQAFDNADTPEKVQALRQQFQGAMGPQQSPGTNRAISEAQPGFQGPPAPDSMLQGQPAMQSAPPLNYQENQDFRTAIQGQNRLDVQGSRNLGNYTTQQLRNQGGIDKAHVSGQYQVAASQAKGADAASIRTGSSGMDAFTKMKVQSAYKENQDLMKAWAQVGKPNPTTGLPPAADDVAKQRADLEARYKANQDIINQHDPHGQMGGSAPSAPPAQPQIVTSPRPDAQVIPWGPDAKSKARPGDLYKFGDGTMHVVGDESGNAVPTPYQPPQTAPQAMPQSQVAPQAQDVPPPPPPMPMGSTGVMGF